MTDPAMARNDNTINVLIIAALLAIGVGYFAPRVFSARNLVATDGATGAGTNGSAAAAATIKPTTATGVTTGPLAVSPWAAAAPGRVEPVGGEIRMTAQTPGRIVEVLAAINDRAVAGDLLIRLDDADAEARVTAAEAEVSVRRKERDGETVTGLARDRRVAEDAVAAADRLLATNRAEFDRWLRARKTGKASPDEIQKARDTVTAARDRVDQTRAAQRKVMSTENLPAQTRLEAAMAAARSDLALADAALERTRIRAPKDVTILNSTATVGETAAPSAEQVLITLGDVSSLRVRAEIEERDVGKVKTGQAVVIRSDAFPGRDFDGKIATLAQSLGAGRISLKGPRRGTEVDVLEIMIDLAGQPPLLPGMRVDVFIKPDAAGPVKAN
jgi:HlyD family secretion protein